MKIKEMKNNFINSSPRISYKKIGKGPPIIFLHGIGGNSTNWEEQQLFLSETFTTIAWDARGYGNSEDYDGPLKFSDFSKDLGRLLEHLRINKAHLVGLSMGGRILMNFFADYKDKIATMTLCDCYYNFKNFLSPRERREYIDIRQKPIKEGKSLTELAPKIIKSLVSSNCSEKVKKKVYDSLSKIHPESYLKTIKETVNYDVSSDLSNFDIPVQLIYGENDVLTPPSLGYTLKNKIKNSQLNIIKKSGHLSNMEQPEIFNRILFKFLSIHKNKANFYRNK